MGTGTSEDVFNLLAIRGPTRGEGMPGIEPGSSDPQSSPLPLRHRGGLDLVDIKPRYVCSEKDKRNYQNLVKLTTWTIHTFLVLKHTLQVDEVNTNEIVRVATFFGSMTFCDLSISKYSFAVQFITNFVYFILLTSTVNVEGNFEKIFVRPFTWGKFSQYYSNFPNKVILFYFRMGKMFAKTAISRKTRKLPACENLHVYSITYKEGEMIYTLCVPLVRLNTMSSFILRM